MTPAERITAALHADTWTEPKDSHPHPDFHRQFNAGQAVRGASLAVDALCPNGERVVLDRTGDTDRLAEPFNIELLTERLRLANARLLAYDGDPRVRPRLEAKAEGVRLALSYISDMTREDGSR